MPEVQELEIAGWPDDTKVSVPCGTCHQCCKKSLVLVLPEKGDRIEDYETFDMESRKVLKFQENGDCWYLGKDGCTIHGRAPFMCRIFDCREQHRMYTRAQREDLVKKGMLNADILRHGAGLIHREKKVIPIISQKGGRNG